MSKARLWRGGSVARSKRRRSSAQFLQIFHALAHSDAFRSLRGNSLKVLIELATRYNGTNNGDLSLSLDEAAKLLRIGKASAQRAFHELEAKGFVCLIKRGCWYGRRASTYRLTWKPHGRNGPTNEWKKFQRPPEPKRRPKNQSSVLEWFDLCINEPALVPTRLPKGPK